VECGVRLHRESPTDLAASVAGGSTGGYWQPKSRTPTATVARGGQSAVAQRTSRSRWIVKRSGVSILRLAETLACAFGRSTGEEWIEYAPKLSPSIRAFSTSRAPLLCVNGIDDSVFPIADMYLLLTMVVRSHGFITAAKMGGGNSQSVIVQWLKENGGARVTRNQAVST
jgi:hypothetical protein